MRYFVESAEITNKKIYTFVSKLYIKHNTIYQTYHYIANVINKKEEKGSIIASLSKIYCDWLKENKRAWKRSIFFIFVN